MEGRQFRGESTCRVLSECLPQKLPELVYAYELETVVARFLIAHGTPEGRRAAAGFDPA